MSATTGRYDPRPVDPATGQPIGPMAQPGYYPGFSTLAQQASWDEATRRVVLDRVRNVPPIRFFTPEQAALMEAIVARVLPQDDRDADHRVPIVPRIDERLFTNRHDGYRYASMPHDREAFTLGLQAIDDTARALHGRGFVELGLEEQERILEALHDGKPPVEHDVWTRMPVHIFWQLLVQDCVEAYYAHPYAWDEIGFGGPAYPRAYMRLERGEPEPWEVREQRYAWEAPAYARSAESEPAEIAHHYGAPGQGGTH